MPYNPQVTDRRADYMLAGAESTANMISSVGQTIAGGITTYAQRREEQDMMAGRLDAMGMLADPQFAEKWTNATPAKQKGIYADAMLQYEIKLRRDEEMEKMRQKKELMEWGVNLDKKAQELDPLEQEQLPGLVSDYLTGATQGLQPDQNFFQKIAGMSSKGLNFFMQAVGKGMDLYDMSNPRQVQEPQFRDAPGGGRVMVNPNNGTAQFIPAPEAQGQPGYTEVPAPAAGNVGILRDGKGGMRVIPGGTPAEAEGPVDIYGNVVPQGLKEATPEEAEARLRTSKILFGD